MMATETAVTVRTLIPVKYWKNGTDCGDHNKRAFHIGCPIENRKLGRHPDEKG
jgi:hypothetical protein